MEEKNATVLRICANIRLARELAGFTQMAFAEKIGIKRSTYAEWETNFIPSVESMMKISELTGFDLKTLVYGDMNEIAYITPADPDSPMPRPEKTNRRSNAALLLYALKTYSASLGAKVFNKPYEDCLKEIERLASERASTLNDGI